MKYYALGSKNDIKIYAIKENGHYVPVEISNDNDLHMVQPDAVIYADSGIYPMTLDELHREWCRQAEEFDKTDYLGFAELHHSWMAEQ